MTKKGMPDAGTNDENDNKVELIKSKKDGVSIFTLHIKNGTKPCGCKEGDQKCGCAECVNVVEGIQDRMLDRSERIAKHALGIADGYIDKGVEIGKKQSECRAVRPDTLAQPPVRSDKKWDTTDWVKLVVGIILLAILFWLLMSQKGCGSNLVAPVEKPCCLDEYREGIRDGMELSQNRSPVYDDRREEEEVDLYDEPDEEEETEVEIRPTTFGQFKAGDPDLTHRILAWFTSQDNANFRFYGSDSLDGENKFVLKAAEMSALITSGKGIRRDSNGDIEVYNTSYTPHNTLHEASRMAWLSGENAKYFTSYKNEQSFEWNVNSTLSRSPPSSETDWSQAVKETLRLLMEKVQYEKIPSVNGRVIFAVNHTSKASGASRTARKKSTSRPSPAKPSVPPALAHNGQYGSPLRPEDIKAYVRGVKPAFGGKDPHHGHDLSADGGSPIFSTSGGRVIKRAYQVNKVTQKGYGHYLDIYDGNYVWRYAHMKSRSIFGKGDTVRKGQQIGAVGDTGSPGAFHLHIECWTLSEYKKKEAGKKATPISEQLWQ